MSIPPIRDFPKDNQDQYDAQKDAILDAMDNERPFRWLPKENPLNFIKDMHEICGVLKW